MVVMDDELIKSTCIKSTCTNQASSSPCVFSSSACVFSSSPCALGLRDCAAMCFALLFLGPRNCVGLRGLCLFSSSAFASILFLGLRDCVAMENFESVEQCSLA